MLGSPPARCAASEVRSAAIWSPVARADILAPREGGPPSTRRSHRTESVKDPGIADVGDVGVGRKTKPMERAEREFDMKLLVESSSTWRQISSLIAESRHLFESDHDLSCAALLKASVLIGPLRAVANASERSEAKGLVDKLTELLVPRMNRLHGQAICGLVLCLKRLGYAPNKLITPIFLYLSEKERLDAPGPVTPGPDGARRKPKTSFTVAERFALLAVFAQMGLKPPPASVNRALANSYPFLKFCTPQDMSNLALALHSWRAILRPGFVVRLMSIGRDHLGDMSSSALVSLTYVLANAGYESSSFHSASLLRAVEPSLGSLSTPSLYPTLMHALLRLNVTIPPDIFDAMCSALMASAKPPAGKAAQGKKKAAAAAGAGAGGAAKTRLQLLKAQEVVVVLGALGFQNKYTPEKEFVPQLLTCLQERCSELSPREAGCALQLLPAVLQGDEDAAQDAADLMDELLAVVEGGLPSMRASDLEGLAAALGELGHCPDKMWLSAFHAELRRRLPVVEAKGGKGAEAEEVAVGRPSLVALAGALAALPAASRAQAPEQVAAILEALLEAGRRQGGFGYFQLQELERSLEVLGSDGEAAVAAAAAGKLPVAAAQDPALDPELEEEGEGDGVEWFTPAAPEPRMERGGEAAVGFAEVEVETPCLVGWMAKPGPDLVRLLEDLREGRERRAAAARSSEAGRQRGRQQSAWSEEPAGSWAEGGDSWEQGGRGGRQQQGWGGRQQDQGGVDWAMEDAWEDRGAKVQRAGGGGFGAGSSNRGGAGAWTGADDGYDNNGMWGGWLDGAEQSQGTRGRGAARGGGDAWGAGAGAWGGAGAADDWAFDDEGARGAGGRRGAGGGSWQEAAQGQDEAWAPASFDAAFEEAAEAGGRGSGRAQPSAWDQEGSGPELDADLFGDQEEQPQQRGGKAAAAAPEVEAAPIVRSTRAGRGRSSRQR